MGQVYHGGGGSDGTYHGYCAINNRVLFNLMYDAVEICVAQFFLFDKKLSGGPIALKRVSC